jgi:dTDP-4-dehydrorhamnose 3,5-epimerase
LVEIRSVIEGVVTRPLKRHIDARGWLMEMFREDELPDGFSPVMAYVSITHPGVARGPHEHREQSDGFCFADGTYEITLWENRPGHPRIQEVYNVGEDNPTFLVIPPGVVHAYKNVGDRDAYVLNFPDRLYAGRGRREPVDEIRHEEIESEFKV